MNDFNLRDAWDGAIALLQSENCPDGFINLHNGGHITRLEVMDNVWQHCSGDGALATVVQRMATHAEEWVRDIAADILTAIERRANRVTDLNEIAITSPLQPGARIRLDGGYESYNPWWLNGKECYLATFARFVPRGPNEMPVAFVELDDEINMVEGCGLQHRGKHALLRLLFVADWNATETVTVHIVDHLPDDVVAFYESHPFGTELESHATYRMGTANGTEQIGEREGSAQSVPKSSSSPRPPLP